MTEPAVPAAPLALTLITRRECTLCDEFAAALARWDGGRGRHVLALIDADEVPGCAARYGHRLPVLLAGEREICAGHFDPVALERQLAGTL